MTTRTVQFPEMKSFSDVFETFTTSKDESPEAVTFMREDWAMFGVTSYDKARKVRVDVGPYTTIHGLNGYTHVYARPVKAIRDYLASAWVGDSHGSFKVIVRGDGTALITAEYSRILGSHWLALVGASSVPEGA